MLCRSARVASFQIRSWDAAHTDLSRHSWSMEHLLKEYTVGFHLLVALNMGGGCAAAAFPVCCEFLVRDGTADSLAHFYMRNFAPGAGQLEMMTAMRLTDALTVLDTAGQPAGGCASERSAAGRAPPLAPRSEVCPDSNRVVCAGALRPRNR